VLLEALFAGTTTVLSWREDKSSFAFILKDFFVEHLHNISACEFD